MCVGGDLLSAQIVCPSLRSLNKLRVINQRKSHFDTGSLDHIHCEQCFFRCFLFIQCLGEEIGADLKAGRFRALHVLNGHRILVECSLSVTAESHADEHELIARIRNCLPVDLSLVIRDIDALKRFIVLVKICNILRDLVQIGKIRGIVRVRADSYRFRPLRTPGFLFRLRFIIRRSRTRRLI